MAVPSSSEFMVEKQRWIENLEVLKEHNARIEENPTLKIRILGQMKTIKSIEECEILQSDIWYTEIFYLRRCIYRCSQVILNTSEFFADLPFDCLVTLWNCLFDQLEIGGFELKQDSLNLLLFMFKNNFLVNNCLQYGLDIILALTEWFLENYETLAQPPMELLKKLGEILDYFGEISSAPHSVFSAQNVDFMINSWTRCVKFFSPPSVISPEQLINGVFVFIRGLCDAVILRQNELTTDHTTLITGGVLDLLKYCLNEETCFKFLESSSLFCALIRLCCCLPLKIGSEPTVVENCVDLLIKYAKDIEKSLKVDYVTQAYSIVTETFFPLLNDNHPSLSCANSTMENFFANVVEKLLIWTKKDAVSSNSKIYVCDVLFYVCSRCLGKEDKLEKIIINSLDLAFDENVDVRKAYVRCWKPCISFDMSEEKKCELVKKLTDWSEAIDKARDKKSQESLVFYLGEIASYSLNWSIYESTLSRLVLFIVDNDENLANLAKTEIVKVGARRNLSLKQLYVETAEYSLQKFVTMFVDELKLQNSNVSMSNFAFEEYFEKKMGELCAAFNFVNNYGTSDIHTWSRLSEKHFVPCLMMNPGQEASKILKALAIFLKTNRNSLIVRNIPYILLKLCTSSREDDENAIKTKEDFVVEEFGQSNDKKVSFSTLIVIESFKSVCVLASYLGHRSCNVSRRLNEVVQLRTDAQWDRDIVGVLIHFEEALRSSNYSSREKLLAILSFPLFLKTGCLENGLGNAKSKALTVLKLSVDVSLKWMQSLEFRIACRDAWFTVVTSLNVEDLQTNCLQMFVFLLPLVEKRAADVCESSFRYLCQEKRDELVEQLNELEFLLNVPKYDETKRRLPFLADLATKSLDVRSSLEKSLTIIRRYENAEIKIMALRKLSHILRTNLCDVYKLVLGAENVDSIIPQLIDQLLITLSHSDGNVKYAASVCLGDLGAIDPGRLQSNSIRAKAFEKKQCHVMDFETKYNTKFIVDLLIELCGCLTGASDGASYNVFSYVVQETLRFFDIRSRDDETQNSPSKAVFDNLSPSVETIVAPFFNTHFIITNELKCDILSPVFVNYHSLTLKQWLDFWLRLLVKQLKTEAAANLFRKLQFAAEFDLNFARFLLPHVILQNLREFDAATKSILEEINSVLTSHEKFSSESQDEMTTTDPSYSKFAKQAAQEIFALLDFLRFWCLENSTSVEQSVVEERDRVENLLNAVSHRSIAERAFYCQAYTRALMFFESDLLNDTDNAIHDHLEKLQVLQLVLTIHVTELYAFLGDTDAVTGVLVVRKTKRQPSANEEILAAECLGNYVEALPYHELIADAEPNKIENHLSLVKCLLKLNQPNLALHYLDGLVEKRKEFEEKLRTCRVETLCKLEDWASLENELNKTSGIKTWGTDVADLLLTARKKDVELFCDKLKYVRIDLLNRLEAVVRDSGAYDRAYKYVLRLHMVSEIENGAAVFLDVKGKYFPIKTKNDVFDEWFDRLAILEQSVEAFNPILDLRRHIFGLSTTTPDEHVRNAVQNSWLQSLRIARKTGHVQSANSLLPKVKTFNLSETFYEEARLLWLNREHDAATNCLTLGLHTYYRDFLTRDKPNAAGSDDRVKGYAKSKKLCTTQAFLRFINFARESSSKEVGDITRCCEDLNRKCPSADSYYCLAFHLDQIESNRPPQQMKFDQRFKIIQNYAFSLRYSSKYLHHAMPRMLTLWLDTVSKLNAYVGSNKEKLSKEKLDGQKTAEEWLAAFNSEMLTNSTALPPYQFYSSFSQLISRLGSQSTSTVNVLKEIISRVILAYPQQCLWMSIAVSYSSVLQRRKICKEIYQLAVSKNKNLKKLIDDFDKLVDLLKKLCHYKTTQSVENMKEKFKDLYCLFSDGKFSQIMLPLQSLLDVTLPTPAEGKSPDENFTPFPVQCIYISEFQQYVQIFQTLQRPKKITMRGSDGCCYSMLCKPKDDLRLDKRVMEFTSLVNAFLLRDPEARRRQLKIRTYAVTPLSEDFGLLEWVKDLEAMRTIIMKIYKEQNVGLSPAKLKELSKKTFSNEKKLEIYKSELLTNHPSVLHLWFRRCFVDPTAWYLARQNYVRTAAVMSMVGFVLGLGDRHGENVLLDTVTGDVVHVDFNCLFNRGEELEVPEVVPFRLTHNMIKAMGPLGYEGPFRKTCEVTMRMMRKETETLRTVLETFLYDPLVEWRKVDGGGTEGISDKAQKNLKNIDLRLKGSFPEWHESQRKSTYGSNLSVESQVSHLIKQATFDRRLSQMYIGWAAYM